MKMQSPATQQEVRLLVDEWTRIFNTGRLSDLAKFYAPDARIIPPGRTALVSGQEITGFFIDIRAQGFRDYAADIGDVFAKEGCLVASGRWTLRGTDGGRPQLYRGNWLNVLSHSPTGWLIAVHMWN